MKKIFRMAMTITIALFTACGSPQEVKNDAPSMTAETKIEKTVTLSKYDNKKDPRCNMDVTDDMTDTVHYEKYVLAFCSSDCKKYFLKDPKKSIAKAELKK